MNNCLQNFGNIDNTSISPSNAIDHMISMSTFDYSEMGKTRSHNERTILSHKFVLRKRRIAIRR
jgi:hypothetical protein